MNQTRREFFKTAAGTILVGTTAITTVNVGRKTPISVKNKWLPLTYAHETYDNVNFLFRATK